MFLGLLDPDPLVGGMAPDLAPDQAPDPFYNQAKIRSKKNLNSYCFATSLSLKNDANVASKSKKQKNWKNMIFSCHLEGGRKYQDPELDPDPLVRGSPRIRIWNHTKMSRIRNTACSTCSVSYPDPR
jgi:hypothetical protein